MPTADQIKANRQKMNIKGQLPFEENEIVQQRDNNIYRATNLPPEIQKLLDRDRETLKAEINKDIEAAKQEQVKKNVTPEMLNFEQLPPDAQAEVKELLEKLNPKEQEQEKETPKNDREPFLKTALEEPPAVDPKTLLSFALSVFSGGRFVHTMSVVPPLENNGVQFPGLQVVFCSLTVNEVRQVRVQLERDRTNKLINTPEEFNMRRMQYRLSLALREAQVGAKQINFLELLPKTNSESSTEHTLTPNLDKRLQAIQDHALFRVESSFKLLLQAYARFESLQQELEKASQSPDFFAKAAG